MGRTRLGLALAVAFALIVPAPTFAAAEPAAVDTPPTFDTPAPQTETADPTPRPRATPEPTRAPRRTPKPGTAVIALPIEPERGAITIGYSGANVLAQAPLLVAELTGYFDAVGLDDVTLSRVPDPLGDLASGDLDLAVVTKIDAAAAFAEDPTLRAVAGYDNYPDGEYGGNALMAAPGLVADEPATVIAFLVAYIAALQDLSDAAAAAEALDIIRSANLRVSRNLAADWQNALGAYAPFDGGFGSFLEGDGLGELEAYLGNEDGTGPDLATLIAGHTLAIAQAWSDLEPNPANALAGPPGITELTVGLADPEADFSPVVTALEEGYFEDAGFESVEIVDVEEPLLGVLQGELDFGVMDKVDAADGSAQGLPLASLAGHRNYAPDGAYGGDLVVASSDVLGEEGSTVSAFLVAYVRALRDLATDATLAPHDGGYGDRGQAGGLGELDAYLGSALGSPPDLPTLIEGAPLEYAQAWWGLPANPTMSEEAE